MRRLMDDRKYVRVSSYRPVLMWQQCAMCGVEFLWERCYSILTDRCLAFPTEGEKERNVVYKYTHRVPQYLCQDCGTSLFHHKVGLGVLITHEEFDVIVDKCHRNTLQPEPKVEKGASKLAKLIPFVGRPME